MMFLKTKFLGAYIPKDWTTGNFAKPTSQNIDLLLSCGDYFKIDKEPFRKLISTDKGELKLAFKMKPSHLELSGGMRTNVRATCVTFSGTNANAIHFLLPEHSNVAEVVDCVNDVRFI